MKEILISRTRECEEIQRCMESDRSEFIAVNGRRRIGKTYLIDKFFNYKYDFTFVGQHNTPAKEQIQDFVEAIQRRCKKKVRSAKNWREAFHALIDYLETLPKRRKKVIFIDEMPWMDTQRSNFVSALENFWNGWANRRTDIVLIATGSATSWMSDKLVKNKGGLHNRITCNLHLSPFTLGETEQYLRKRNCRWDRYQIVQCYMLFGGVPFYLSLLRTDESLVQNVDRLFYAEGAQLRDEFEQLYNALFNKAHLYINVVKLLSDCKGGLTREEIKDRTNIEGTFLSKVLSNLVKCDFVTPYSQFGVNKSKTVYRLTDFFTLFYNHFVAGNNSKDESWWSRNCGLPSAVTWMGLSFELVCLRHHKQIKAALGISGMSTSLYTWKYKGDSANKVPGFQIDMIIERADRHINLCEMKFSKGKFTIKFDYEEELLDRLGRFEAVTKTNVTVLQTFVTTYGITDGKHKSIVHSEVTMNDLFNS